MRARAVEASLVGAAALLLTVVMTWPIAPRILTAGRSDSGDGRYSIWNVAWVAHALVVDPLHVYDANIFYPHRAHAHLLGAQHRRRRARRSVLLAGRAGTRTSRTTPSSCCRSCWRWPACTRS